MKKAHSAVSVSPLTGPYETNKNAKLWTLNYRTGKVYEFRNLSKFVRDHLELFDGASDSQAWAGISKLKYAQQGKIFRGKSDYKGFLLVDWKED